MIGDAVGIELEVDVDENVAKAPGFKYHNSDAKLSGGVSILKAKRTSDGTFKLTVLCYGDIGPGATTMTTHIFVAGQEWTVTATWRATATGWVFVSAL